MGTFSHEVHVKRKAKYISLFYMKFTQSKHNWCDIHKNAKYIIYEYLMVLLYFTKADRILVQNARNLMTVVLKAMTAAEAVCVKVGIYQFIIYVCPLTSSIPIISPTTEHTKCIPLSTTIKHTNHIHYHQTYLLYGLQMNIPTVSTIIKHTNYIC